LRQIFISYDYADQPFAVRLAEDLGNSGAQVWLDVKHAEPGRNWSRSVERALSESHMMLVVLSPYALDSAHVAVEWQAYLEANRPVIPVMAQPCAPPGPLRTRRPVDFTRDYWRAFHELTPRLIEYGMRTQRIDPVIWTMQADVQDYREEKVPVTTPVDTIPEPLSLDDDPADSGLRRMVSALRDLLRPKRGVAS